MLTWCGALKYVEGEREREREREIERARERERRKEREGWVGRNSREASLDISRYRVKHVLQRNARPPQDRVQPVSIMVITTTYLMSILVFSNINKFDAWRAS